MRISAGPGVKYNDLLRILSIWVRRRSSQKLSYKTRREILATLTLVKVLQSGETVAKPGFGYAPPAGGAGLPGRVRGYQSQPYGARSDNLESGMRNNVRAVFARWVSPLWPITIAGLLVGAVVGGWVMQGGSESQATASVRMYTPVDPDQIMTGAAPDPDSQQNYISGELTYLTSPGFADAVQKQLNRTQPPPVSAIQDSRSSIVSMSAIQPNYAEAQRIVDAALKVYSDHAAQQVRERGQAAIDAIDAVIARVGTEIAQIEDPNSVAPADIISTPDNPQTSLQQLYSQRLAIEAQMTRSAAVQIVQPTMKTPVAGAPGWSLGAVGGALGGGFLALAGAYIWRRRVGVVTSPSGALTGQIERVLSPVVRLGTLSESGDTYARLARSLYAQLPTPRTGRLLVIGASVDSGSDEITPLIASAIAEHRQVNVGYLAQDARPVDSFGAFADPEDGLPAVIDGGSVDTSPALLAAAADASQIIVVVKIGRDFTEAVRVASRVVDRNDVPISAVCTQGGPHKSVSPRDANHPEREAADAKTSDQVRVDGGGSRENGNPSNTFDGFAVTK